MEAVLIVFIVFASIVAVIVGPGYFKAQSRAKMLDSLRAAHERGQPISPELIEAVSADPKMMLASRSPRERAYAELKSGTIWLCVALAMIAFGSMISWVEDEEAFYVLTGMAAFPGFIGVALIVFGLLGRNRAAV